VGWAARHQAEHRAVADPNTARGQRRSASQRGNLARAELSNFSLRLSQCVGKRSRLNSLMIHVLVNSLTR
jgi:hypothetical protein